MTLNQNQNPHPAMPTPPPLPLGQLKMGQATMSQTMDNIAPRPPAPRKRLSLYVVAWSLIGLLAAAYLTALAVRPDLVTEYLPAFRPGEPEGNQGQRAMSKAVAEVQTLRQSVSQVQLDVAKIKTAVAASEQRQEVIEKTLGARLTTLEEKITFTAPNVAAAKPAAPAPAAAANAAAKTAPPAKPTAEASAAGAIDAALLAQVSSINAGAPIETGSIASTPGAVAQPKVINARPAQATAPAAPSPATATATAPAEKPAAAADSATKPAAAETASAATALPGFGPAVVSPAKEPVGLRISNGPSLDALRLSWSLLADRHPAQLKNLEARYVTRAPTADGDPSFDLVAGPVKSQAEAKRICKALATKNIPCQIGTFEGAGL